jgi:recombinational DNA repair ATPase RecF
MQLGDALGANLKLIAFRIRMYKNIADSGRVEVENLTVIVGKNEAGKTSLLRALHKFKPFKPDPYSIEREWPRGNRRSRTDTQVVCEVGRLRRRLDLERKHQ